MSIPENALRNEVGQVAMKWALNRPAQTIQIHATKKYYTPVYKQNVAMIFVDEEDVGSVLAIRLKTCNCNNGTYQQAYGLANEIDINLHKCGNRHCD